MKNIIILILSLVTINLVQAQQDLFKYQAVARNDAGKLIVDQDISLRFTIYDDNVLQTPRYIETHSVKTSDLGIFSVFIGDGSPQQGKMSSIDWAASDYAMAVEVDFSNGTNYTDMGGVRFLSVPYALHARTVENKDDADADPNNELQMLSIDGTKLTLSNGNTVNLPTGGGGGTNDDDPNNEIQDLNSSKNGTQINLGISLGGQGTTIDVADNDNDATNELQNITADRNGNIVTLNISGGQGSTFEVQDEDADPNNEIQDISLDGTKLSIEGGSEVDLKETGYWKLDQTTNTLKYETNPIQVNGVLQNDANNSSDLNKEYLNITDHLNNQSSTLDTEGLHVSGENSSATYGTNGSFAIAAGVGTTHELFDHTLNFPGNTSSPGSAVYSKDSLFLSNYAIQDASGQSKLTYSNFTMGLENRLMNLYASKMKMESFEVPEEKQYFHYSADSLNFFNGESNGNVPYASSKMDHFTINFTDHFSKDFSCLSAQELCLRSDLGDLTMGNTGFVSTQKISPQDEFNRVALLHGGLLLWNEAKWQNVFLGEGPNGNAGLLRLTNGTGLGDIARLGYGFDGLAEGGILQLMHHGQDRVWLNAADNYGEICLFDKTNLCQFQLDVSNGVSSGAYMALSDSFGFDRILGYMETFTPIGGGMEQTYGVWEVDGHSLGKLVGAYEGDTIYSYMNSAGFETEGAFTVSRSRFLRGDVFKLVDESLRGETGLWDEGRLITNGPDGSLNVELTTSAEVDLGFNADFGAIYVYDDEDIRRAGMEVRQSDGLGVVWADVKNFRIDHPESVDKEIVYASLEGPEAAAYSRGTSSLKNGKVFVKFPEHFMHVANPETMTIQLTPLYANTIGLAVIEKTSEGFWVQERMDGEGSFDFDWQVTCVRKGYEDFQVIRNKKMNKSKSKK